MRAHTLPWLFRHFEKTLLGAALGWLVIIGVGFATPASSLNPAELRGSMRFVQRHFHSAVLDSIARPDWNSRLKKQLSPDAVPEAVPFGDWLVHQRPLMLYRVGPCLPQVDCTHRPASLMNVDADQRGQVTLEWSAPEQGEHVVVDYTLQRRAGDGPWTDLMDLDPDETTVVDENLTPDTAYSYRVVSSASLDTEHPLVIQHGLTGLPEEVAPSLQSEASASKTTLPNTVFVLNSVQPGNPILRRTGGAQIYVYRWNPERSAFDRRLFHVQVGDAIGSGAFKTDAILREVSVVRRPVAGTAYTKPVGLATLEAPQRRQVLDDQTPFGQ